MARDNQVTPAVSALIRRTLAHHFGDPSDPAVRRRELTRQRVAKYRERKSPNV